MTSNPEPASRVTEPLPPEAATGTAASRTSYRALSAAVGSAALLRERLFPTRTVSGWETAALGAAFEAEDGAARLFAAIGRSGAYRRYRSVRAPLAVSGRARRYVAALADRGAVERDLARDRAARAADALVAALATAPVVERVVDAQLDRVLRPLVITVLDDVLGMLEADPARVQALIRGQRESMVGELVGRIRQGAAAGDTAVDRVTGRARIWGKATPSAAPEAEVLPPPAPAPSVG